jgi:hypothetical protein
VPATPSNQVRTGPSAAPDLASLRAILRPHAEDEFDENATNERGCPVDQRLGAYVAMLERNAAGGAFTGGCGAFPARPAPIDPPADPAYWFCRIDGSTNEGGEPWHYELRIRLRKADRAPDFTTVACPGTP